MRLTLALALAALAACGGRALDSHGQPAPDEPPPDAGAVVDSGSGGSASQPDADLPLDAGRDASAAGSSGALGDAGAGSLGGMAGTSGSDDPCTHFATRVVEHAFGGGQNHGQAIAFPQAVLGPPVANDPGAVVSLGNGGWVALEFGSSEIVDGPGIDFTVFENPLGAFKELATVAVSEDGANWTEFPCTAVPVTGQAPDYGSCAGVAVVYSTPKNGIDPLDPAVSGGDHYDLADIGVSHARYVRITDRVDLTGNDGVFDLDAVGIINAACE